ncbi:MAG: NAD(P)/FAD-dependent oxidoreductase [Bacteroidota bacterium]
MNNYTQFDVIIVGGSYSGLAAGMALGRSLKRVLIIDSGKPCNRQTPHSHNFITQDGKTPLEIATLAKQQVQQYDSVTFFNGLATKGEKTSEGFDIHTSSGQTFSGKTLLFATGIKDIMPDLEGYSACWGISVLHCPYCHGYEVRNETTGILGNGEYGFEFSNLISNWTKDLTLYTNGKSTLTAEQTTKLNSHNIAILEKPIEKLEHNNGYIHQIVFKDGTAAPIKALYARNAFEQHCTIPETLGCELTDEGYIKVDATQKTNVDGIYACGDNTTRMRAVVIAIAAGATAGMMLNKEMVMKEFS